MTMTFFPWWYHGLSLSAGQHVPFGSRSGRRRRKRPWTKESWPKRPWNGGNAWNAWNAEAETWRPTVAYEILLIDLFWVIDKGILAVNWCLCDFCWHLSQFSQLPGTERVQILQPSGKYHDLRRDDSRQPIAWPDVPDVPYVPMGNIRKPHPNTSRSIMIHHDPSRLCLVWWWGKRFSGWSWQGTAMRSISRMVRLKKVLKMAKILWTLWQRIFRYL